MFLGTKFKLKVCESEICIEILTFLCRRMIQVYCGFQSYYVTYHGEVTLNFNRSFFSFHHYSTSSRPTQTFCTLASKTANYRSLAKWHNNESQQPNFRFNWPCIHFVFICVDYLNVRDVCQYNPVGYLSNDDD